MSLAPESRARPLALITGATSGIGKALAHCFAADGYDVILVARDEAALATTANELSARHGVGTFRIKGDLSRPETPRQITEELKRQSLHVDVLVNNAGFGVHGPFVESDLTSELAMVNLQIGTLLALTKDLVPAMVAKGTGGVLNVASVYSFSPVVFQSVYGACKAFIWSFSEALRNETRGTGIKVSLLCPGSTATEFRRRAGVKEKRRPATSAEFVAARGYAAFKHDRRLSVPGLKNKVFVIFARHLPVGGITAVLRIINRFRGVGAHGTSS